MDADNTPERRPPSTPGGRVEPADRVNFVRERFHKPIDVRYELRDPFAEVTYRANSIDEIVAKAEQLGSSRFVAIDAQGQRTTLRKVDGEWERGPRRPARSERPDLPPVRDEAPEASNVVPLTGPSKAAPQPEATAAKAISRIDAEAERAALVERLEAALRERYIVRRAPVVVGDVTIGRTEYRFRGDTSRVAFTESTFRLATDTNSPSVARSMVDVAEARNWKALRVSGNDDFKRMVWLEASVRGVRTLGYDPNPGDLELLHKERERRLVNRIEPSRPDNPALATNPVDKSSARGGGGRKTVLAAIEAVLVAKRVPAKQREAIMRAAAEKLAQRIREGRVPRVRVYDKAAPSHRPVVTPTPDVQRSRERAAPVR